MSSPDSAPPTTFPPDRHILRDLRVELETGPHRHFRSRMPLVPEIQARDGRIQAGVLATLADLAGATVTLSHVFPDWMATADLTTHVLAPALKGPLVANAEVLRAGRGTIVTEVAMHDEGAAKETVVGQAFLTFARIVRPDSTESLDPPPEPRGIVRSSMALEDSGLSAPYREHQGIRVIHAEDGVAEVERSDYNTNSFGTLQGGALASLTEGAAEAMLRTRTDYAVARDLAVHYLAQGPRGPYRTAGTVLRQTDDEALVRVEVLDQGSDTLMSVAKVALSLGR